MAFGFHSTAEDVTEGLDLSGKTYLVTGCNSGLGSETVRVLAKRGASIVCAARSEDKASDAMTALGVDGVPVACDLGDLASVAAAVDTVRRGAPLDGIIANAGVMALQERQLIDGIEAQFYINHIGHFALITQLVDHLTEKGRVVVLSSGAHRMAPQVGIELDDLSMANTYEPWKAYGQSKLANLLFARSLSERLGPKQTANSVHPGVIDTNLGRHVPDKEAMYERMKNVLKTVEQGAATQCYVATHRSLGKTTGMYFSDNQPTKPSHRRAKDAELAAALWDASEAIVE